MIRRNREIFYSLAAIVPITCAYLAVVYWGGGLPGASTFVGHTIGVVGIILMLMAEVLYSIRKQMTDARWGNMAGWLRFHIFSGLVGPYLVLLHTSMRFRGLAGLTMLFTAIVVASGIVGRYVYTRVARDDSTADQRAALAKWHAVHVPLTWALFALAAVHVAAALYFATLQR